MSDIQQARQHAFGDLPRRTAQRLPDKLAIVDGDVRLTFRELDELVSRAGGAIAEQGLVKGDRLALLSHNCWQFAVLAFATARVGVVLVPINFMLGAAEVAFVLEHSEASAFVYEDAMAPLAADALALAPVQQTAAMSHLDWFTVERECPVVPMADDDPVRIMYTSGTESRPKGAMLTSRSLMWQYVSCTVDGGMTADDVELHTLPLFHCAQLDCFLAVDVYLGATSVLLPGPDPKAVMAAIQREGVTKYFAPPTIWIGLLRSPGFEEALASLRKGYYGASAMPVEVLKELQRRLPEIRLWNFYGQTEMSPLATILGPDQQLSHAGSAGGVSLHVETQIVDDDGVPQPTGTVGEIVHRSPHATLGYYKDEAKTAEAFAGGWFHSGDLGYVDGDRRLWIVDRKKDMIKTGGENVASREVEEAVYGLEGVAEVAVFGVSHPRWVEAVVAVVVPKPGFTLTEDGVIAHARTVLAGFKVPKHVVIADSLPKNPSGKILKRQLRDEHAEIAARES